MNVLLNHKELLHWSWTKDSKASSGIRKRNEAFTQDRVNLRANRKLSSLLDSTKGQDTNNR